MNIPERTTGTRRPAKRHGFTLAEVAISTVLVGLLIVAGMRTVGASIGNSNGASNRLRALRIAEDLMHEILQAEYKEPTDAALFGVEGSEAAGATGPRTLWDDVDDYKAWTASPPQSKDGVALSGGSGWRHWVEVKQVAPSDYSVALADTDDRGAKRIRVFVSYNGQALATLTAVRTKSWVEPIPDPLNDRTSGSRPATNYGPFAVATATPVIGSKPLSVQFDATTSSDPEGDPLTYSWDMGDGATRTGARPQFVFDNPGASPLVRNVVLTVTDPQGAQATATITITVNP